MPDKLRNTPANAGQTCLSSPFAIQRQKHPRERGADKKRKRGADENLETPPRTRGRRIISRWYGTDRGNTPANAGQTILSRLSPDLIQKHPRERGADLIISTKKNSSKETPPRTRGRRRSSRLSASFPGNTPANAGQTRRDPRKAEACRKHPRERGADYGVAGIQSYGMETPPRTRGRPFESLFLRVLAGNTPANAGQTATKMKTSRLTGKHPRERGADPNTYGKTAKVLETPPRTRGRPFDRGSRRRKRRKHPRERGADATPRG